MNNSKKLRCASFFSGVGGIDIGFEQAGFKTIYANEFDKNAVKTLKENFSFQIQHEDIRNIDEKTLPNFDIMIAGFPCQAFSIAGKSQGFEDEQGRGVLFLDLNRIIKEKQPQVVFLENVKNLISHDKGNTFKTICSHLENEGYFLKFEVLDAKKHGNLPQNRERTYIVCFKDKEKCDNFQFPNEVRRTQHISDMLEKEETINPKYYYTNKSKVHPFIVGKITHANTLFQWRRAYVRENKNNVCPTLTANMGTGGHNVPLLNPQGMDHTIRKLTPRECFNFQGYPSDFKFPEGMADSHLYKQAGNSVPVSVIKRIAEEIKKVL